MSRKDAGPNPAWDQARWVKILDRIEHRQPDLGLRFWGPPLWLEVTMMGPDSDLWTTAIEQPKSWDWQSSAPCDEVADLAAEGADDDRLLAVVSRYTIENLILNAVHEIGEWLRFDGQRLFPAHIAGGESRPSDREDQGNGAVSLQLEFEQMAHGSAAVATVPAPDRRAGENLVRRLTDAATPSRFTYLRDTTISYEPAGPVIHRWSHGTQTTAWRSTWSTATLEAAGANEPELGALAARDVHRALVFHEADRVCRAFHVDGARPWSLAAPAAAFGGEPADNWADAAELLSILITYAGCPS